jgi:EAL domain-containing protein (putative c-di-GMP-specific phosphodiesterase class I)
VEVCASRVVERVQAPIVIAGREIVATASVGIVVSTVPVEEPDELMRHADQAMYAAKRTGKARAVTFNPAMSPTAWPLLDLVEDLRHALESDELCLVYQPIVDLTSGRIRTMEALVRWLHPVRGLISPIEFVPIAEETDLIFPLGQWVLEEACRQAQTWSLHTGALPPPAVSVNLSAREFEHPRLVDHVAEVLLRTGLAPERLILEITERVAMAEEGAATRTLQALKGLGVGLAVDDFGTGYSGLSSLKVSMVDTLKVDRTFVAGLGSDERDTAIVRAVIALAEALNLTTTAEGIETIDQAAALLALGCEEGQGYYFSRPLPAEQIAFFLSREDPFELRGSELATRVIAAPARLPGGTNMHDRAFRTIAV